MPTIDIYTTPQCGFCNTLKAKLAENKLAYTAHDVTTDKQNLMKMHELTNGAMSVPVTVINKGTKNQQVLIGYPDAAQALELDTETKTTSSEKELATLTCPKCKHKQQEAIPTTACVPFYQCQGCQETIPAQGQDCCVFCSYADKKCPLKKDEGGCADSGCSLG